MYVYKLKKNTIIHACLLFAFVFSNACAKLPDFPTYTGTSGFTPDTSTLNAKVDILFVIDNSGSMERDQQVLADSFSSFISKFTDKNLQYQIGVISTDTCSYRNSSGCGSNHWSSTKTHPSYPSTTAQYKYGGIFNNGIGGLLTRYDIDGIFYSDGQSVVSPNDPLKYLAWDSDPDPIVAKSLTISRFTENAKIGTTGSGSEAPLGAVAAAIDRASAYNGTRNVIDVNFNDGFFRPGAFTAIIIVTDEDEGFGWEGEYPTRPGSNPFDWSSFDGTNNLIEDYGPQTYLSGRAGEICVSTVPSVCSGYYPEEVISVGSSLNTYQQERIDYVLSSLENLKGTNLDKFVLGVIAVPPSTDECVITTTGPSPTSTVEKSLNFEPAHTLQHLVDDVNGNYSSLGSGKLKARFANICSDFSADLDLIASDIVEANANYALDETPNDPNNINVYVDNVLQSNRCGVFPSNLITNCWDYLSPNKSIQFFGTAVPDVTSKIRFEYTSN